MVGIRMFAFCVSHFEREGNPPDMYMYARICRSNQYLSQGGKKGCI